MSIWRPGETALTRTARVATLYQPAGLMERAVMSLIDPKITHLPLDAEVWMGTQRLNTNRRVEEVEQAWLVRPRKKDDQPLRPFDLKAWKTMNRRRIEPDENGVGKGWIKPGSRR